MSLLNSEESVEALVGFRQQQADQNLRMLADLQYKELERLENEISATMASLRVHYESPVARNYNIDDAYLRVHYESPVARNYNTDDALNSLATFM